MALRKALRSALSYTANDFEKGRIDKVDKNKLIVNIAYEIARAAVTVGITVFILLQFFYKPPKPIVVLDIKELIGHEQSRAVKLPPDKAAEQIALHVKNLSDSIKKRDDIVLVKDAVINPEKLRDITNEYKQ